MSCAGRLAGIGYEKVTALSIAFMSRRQAASHSQPRTGLNLGRPYRAQQALFGQGEELSRGFRVIRGFGVIFGVVSPRGRATEQGKRRGIAVLRVLCEAMRSRIRVSPVKATDQGVAFRTRQPDPSRSGSECDISKCRVLKAAEDPVALWVPMEISLCMIVRLSDYRCLLCMALVSGTLAPIELEERVVSVVDVLFT
ncbi:hypothetical protein Taro_037734 [Colocasia esculenta]|uniref:Uncharacterized protein n=1 Tax=Colocasia esculenta TaxID=4460 RepID=A0A843W6D5_COLES|nr:hypothetical protein [Colocasia esculenta]